MKKTTTAIYIKMIEKIIHEQVRIIGPLAWNQAKKVSTLTINEKKIECKRNEKETIANLVQQYERIFGQASVEVCRDAVRNEIAQLEPEEIPESLR